MIYNFFTMKLEQKYETWKTRQYLINSIRNFLPSYGYLILHLYIFICGSP